MTANTEAVVPNWARFGSNGAAKSDAVVEEPGSDQAQAASLRRRRK